jgi:excinuclease UvrABC nuclease subunit
MKEIKGNDKTYKISQNDCFWNMLVRLEQPHKTILAKDDITNNRGVYVFWDWNDKPIRIGKAVKARNRILSYYSDPNNWDVFEKMYKSIAMISVIYTKDETESSTIEIDLIKKHKPKHNKHYV